MVSLEQINSGKTIAVFGSSRRDEDSEHYREAYDLGRVLARAGYAVLSGGYNGSMGAVSRGADEAGGRVIGITCAVFDPLPPNAWLTEEIKAPTMLDRLAIMLDRSDGFVAVRGGIGTLSEVTLAWSLLQTRSQTGKPLGAAWCRLAGHRRCISRPQRPGRLDCRVGAHRPLTHGCSPSPHCAPNTSRPSAPGIAGWGRRAIAMGQPSVIDRV